MAIRLSKDLTNQTTETINPGTSKGFDITADANKSYDLDKISAGKSRTSNEVLRTQVGGKETKTGSVSVRETESRIIANNSDAVKYLFRNEPSTDAYTPSVTLRRPIVIWEEGETPYQPLESNGSIHDTIYELEDEIIKLRKELTTIKTAIVDDIQFYNDGRLKTERNSIPTVGAAYDFIKNNVSFNKEEDKLLEAGLNEFSLEILNSKVTPIDGSVYSYSLDLSDRYYECVLIDSKDNYYQVNLGGK